MSLYTDLGGKPALGTALDRFYDKVLADERISGYFDGVDLGRLKKTQASFFAMALGGPNEYAGRNIKAAHELPREKGLTEEHYHLFMDYFEETLAELGVPQAKIDEVMAIAHTGKDDVLDH